MPKLNLKQALAIKDSSNQIIKLKTSFGEWTKPSVSVPVIAITSGSGYSGSVYTSTVTGQWFADDVEITGETGSTLIMTIDLEGKAIRCGNSNIIQMWTPEVIPTSYVLDIRRGLTTTETGFVTSWEATSGNLIFTQSNASNQPKKTTFDGYEVLAFAGPLSGARKLVATTVLGAPTKRTVILFGIPTTSGSSNNFIVESSNYSYQFRRESSKIVTVKRLNYQQLLSTSWTWENNVPGILGSRLSTESNGNNKISFNGDSLELADNNLYSFTATAQLNIGALSNNSQYFNGYLSSLVICEDVVSDDEYSKIEGWMAHTLNAQGLLTEEHAYKTLAPRIQ